MQIWRMAILGNVENVQKIFGSHQMHTLIQVLLVQTTFEDQIWYMWNKCASNCETSTNDTGCYSGECLSLQEINIPSAISITLLVYE